MLKLITIISVLWISSLSGQTPFETDTITTNDGNLVITFIAHGTLMFSYNDHIVQVDPVNRYADYSQLPKADIIMITHHHRDHLDTNAITAVSKKGTTLILTQTCFEKTGYGTVMKNGETETVHGIKIDALPAYNLVHKRENGEFFHPKGIGNGYVLTFGDKRVYIAGDTENIPEMKSLSGIDIAFVPMNLPYTMTPQMAADAVRMLNPKILYPYHFGKTNPDELVSFLKDLKNCEIRIRKMK